MDHTATPIELEVFARVGDQIGLTDIPVDALERLAAAALERGISPIIAQVARDTSEPRVARERATARLIMRVLSDHQPATAVDGEFCLA